jgi:cellulose synthase/poly-beta-1,6-N-acetylglucosamine synthase-like glycosyltransferase
MALTLAVVFLLLAIHPFVTYPVTLYVARALMERHSGRGTGGLTPPGALPSMAICVSAYNEESLIVAKAENLLALQKTVPACELLIYVDAATDRTVALLEAYRDRITIVVGNVRQGKSYGLNQLVARSTAEILVFTDANVMVDENALVEIGEQFSRPEVGCVCGHLKFRNAGESATAAAGNAYWRLEDVIRRLESDTFGIVGVDGSLFAARRELYPFVPPDIIDDFYVSMKVLLGGHKVVHAPEAFAFERLGSDAKEEFGRKVRIACQAFNVHRLLWTEICAAPPGVFYAYVSHRLLKWLIIYNLGASALFILLAACAFLSPTTVAAAALGGCLVMLLSWLLDLPPARQAASLILGFAGAGWGVVRSLRGDRFQVWNPIATARQDGGSKNL